MAEIFLSDKDLGVRYGVHQLTPRRWTRDDPTFPKPVKLSPGCARWRLSDIEAWEAAKATDKPKT